MRASFAPSTLCAAAFVLAGCEQILGISDPTLKLDSGDTPVPADAAMPVGDATLTELSVTGATLTPPFSPQVTAYTVDLPLRSESLPITASASAGATLSVNGSNADGGTFAAPIDLALGETIITLEVTGEETTTYTIQARRGRGIAETAYLKASNAETNDKFGWLASVDMDGNTLVVGAPGEASAALSVNGDQTDNSAPNAGAAYVFVRDDGGAWRQQAYLKSPNTAPEIFFGTSVAVHGDTIVVGAYKADFNGIVDSGVAYVYQRNGELWDVQSFLVSSNIEADDWFGRSVDIYGDTIVVGAPHEDGSATGVGGFQGSNSRPNSGAVYVFSRKGFTWTQDAYIKASNTDQNDLFGATVALHEDTLAVGAPFEDSAARTVGGNQSDNSAINAGAAYVFYRTGTTWAQQAYIKASNTEASDQFGGSTTGEAYGQIALDRDTLVIGAVGESSNARGVNGNQDDNSLDQSGAAYVFVRSGTEWSQQAYLKSSNPGVYDGFGRVVSLDGDILVASAECEESGAPGINGDETDNSRPCSGAAYLFVRRGTEWSQAAYIKASDPDEGDEFSDGVAVSGYTIAIGSPRESGRGQGVNADPFDDSKETYSSGAVYVFE